MVLFLVPSIILGVLGHKAVRGTHSKIAELTATPEPLVKSARTTLTALSFMSVTAGFTSAVRGFCAVVNTYNGSSAHDEPIKLHTAIVADNPIRNLCGVFSNLDAMAAYLVAFRNVVGQDATFHILCPSTTLVFIPDPIEFCKDVGDIRIEGELNNQTGKPYIYLNMPDAPANMFNHVCNVADLRAPPNPSVWPQEACFHCRRLGCVGAAVLAVPLLPAAAVGAVASGAVMVGGVAAGAAAGTISGTWTGEKIEQAWG
ncbi:hypothetical protein KCU98_g15109, partial [Aureobasidium melanogenum]